MRASRATAKALAAEAGPSVDYSRELLMLMARVLTLTGQSPKELARQFLSVCHRLKEPKQPWDPSRSLKLSWAAHVMSHWYADPRCLDSRGVPLPLALNARGPSLTSLIKRVLPHGDPEAVIEALRQVKAIRRHGERYRPTGRQIALQHQRLSGWLHGLALLLGLLRTIEHNIAHPKGRTLLERAAINPRFPVRYLPEMHQRFKERAAPLLWQIDGDMRKRERASEAEDVVGLGLGIFAFEDPPTTGRAGRTARGRVRGRRPSRKVRSR